MGIIKSINDWEVARGEDAGDFVQRVLNSAGDFLCGLREKYPNSFFDRSFGRGVANSFCGTSGEPVGEPPNFDGGQCVGTQYDYEIDYVSRFGGNEFPGTKTLTGYGAIESIKFEFNPPGVGNGAYIVMRGQPGTGIPSGATSIFLGNAGTTGEVLATRLTGFLGNNNCGNAPDTFPPDPARDPDDFKTTVNVCSRDSEGNEYGCVDLDIELSPDEEKYDLPLCITVDGKKICLDADGWSVEDSTEEPEEEPEEEEFDEVEILTWVLVKVTEIKPKSKRIIRPNAKDSEVFAGYIAFAYTDEVGQYWLPAQPIRKEFNAFRVAKDAQEYSVYTNFDFQVQIREIKETIKIPKEVPPE